MDLPLGESGAVYTNPDGSRSSIVYSSDFLVTTYEDIADGLKKINKTVEIGKFSITDDQLDTENSVIEYLAKIHISFISRNNNLYRRLPILKDHPG